MHLFLCTIRLTIPSLIIALLVSCALTGTALAQLVDITPSQSKVGLDAELRYWASLGPVPGPAIKAYRAGEFSREKETATHGFGHAPEMWFALELRNDSFDDGRVGDPFVIVYDAPAIVGYRLFLVREDGLTENLVDFSVYERFNPADHVVNRLRSPEVLIAPGEQVTIMAHLQLGLAPISTLHVYRPDALTGDSLMWASSLTAFYAFCLSCLVIGFGFQVAMRSLVGVIYIALFVIFLAALANSDMLIFRFVMPDNPWLFRATSYAIFSALAAALCALVGEGMHTPGEPRHWVSRLMMALCGIAVLGFLATFFVETDIYIYLAFGLCAIALAVNIFLPDSFRSSVDNPNVGIRLVSAAAFLSAGFVMMWSLFGWHTEWLGFRALLKLSYGLLMITAMAFLTGNLIVLRLRHLSAVEARVEALEAEAEKSRQLLETERAYVRARETAAARQRQLATASHDIKQPLLSLRTTFDTLAIGMEQSIRDRLREAFTYLETLSKSYVDGTVPENTEKPLEKADTTPETETEVYALSVPLHTVQQMFNGEAVSKGLSLRVADTSLQTTAPPIVLMRILTNLVSNALKYTDKGGVLIGVRRDGPTIWICDTGRGMTSQELARFQQAYAKGKTSTGHGLGLSVCFDLAAANDMPLDITSTVGRGTVFSLSLAAHGPGVKGRGLR